MHFKKQITLCLKIAFIVVTAACNNSNSFKEPSGNEKGLITLTSRACYFADADSIEKQTQIKIDTASCREIEQITSIMEYVGLPQNFKIYRGDIDNALATVVNNQRVIIYNKDLFSTMDEVNSSYWTSLFIIAHEIGHHLADNISDTSNVLSAELDADRFAGFLLYRMGADSNQVIGAVASNLISATRDSESHPSKEKRLEAVKESWRASYDLRFKSAVPPPVYDRFTEAIGTEFEKFQAGFSHEYLMFNSMFLTKWGLKERIDYYDQDYFYLDTAYLENIIDSKYLNFKGIITDVQKLPANPDFKDIKLLSVQVNLTQLAPATYYPGTALNENCTFIVAYQPLFSYDKLKDFYDFFIGGRRIDFSIYPSNDNTGKITNYISNAYPSKELTPLKKQVNF